MDADRWARIESIGSEAAEMSGSERAAFLDDACRGDSELRIEIESLLAQVEAGDSFLGTPLVQPPVTRTPDRIADFRIVAPIGSGGMGTVYEAERSRDGFTQRVALKLLHARLADSGLVERFMTERRILAVLDHPGIARFIDGGATGDGQPYVVMEYVEGSPLTDYCRETSLDLDGRLGVFDQVCEAVQHAHESLVVHRDLKPSNILVTDSGQPKLLDFGISKLLMEGAQETTRTDQYVLTPRYAAPEQVSGGPITTGTDVYALGIVLYQLLTGSHPYATAQMGLLALHKATLTQEVERPSSRVGRTAPEAATDPPVENTTGALPEWRRLVAGDLDSIVLKALRKEPERRYATVAALRDDLQNWRDGRPVSAQPDSTAYRVKKFVTRHSTSVAAGVIAFLLLAGSALFSTVQFRRAEQEAAEARYERDRAEGVVSFMTGLFEWADPNRALGAAVTARELLSAGSGRVDSAFASDPELQASLYGTIAPIYTRIGLHEEAEAAARKALDVLGTSGSAEVRAIHTLDLARGLHGQARWDEAEVEFRRAVDIAADDPAARLTHARALALLGGFHAERRTKLDEAEQVLRASLGAYAAAGHPRSPDATIPMQALAMVVRLDNRSDEAIELLEEALGVVRDSLGPMHTRAAAILTSLGATQAGRGDYEASIPYLEESRDLRARILGPDHDDVGASWYNLAQAYYETGRPDDGAEAYERALSIREAALGEEDPRVANTHWGYGYYAGHVGQDNETALVHLEAAADLFRRIGGEAYPTLGLVVPEIARSQSLLGRWEDAEQTLLARLRWAEDQGGAPLESARNALVDLYERWGKPERAALVRTPPA